VGDASVQKLELKRGQVQTYTIYVHDRRYSVPTLLAADFAGPDRAREFAAERLASSPHYFAIEVWEDDTQLLRLEKDGARDPQPSNSG
jgi:hypothetical protein